MNRVTTFAADVSRVAAAELFKFVRKRRTYLLAGLWWIVLPIVVLAVARVVQLNASGSFLDAEGGVAALLQAVASPHGLATVALTAPAFLSPTFYVIVAALLAATTFGEEQGLKMWKTTLVALPRRGAVLVGKIVAMQLVAAAFMAGAFVITVLVAAGVMPLFGTDASGDWAALLGRYALQWAFMLPLLLLASLSIFVTRNVAAGMVTTFFLPPLLEALYAIWKATVGFEPVNRLNALFQALELQRTLQELPRFFLTNNAYLPARSPAMAIVESFPVGDELPGASNPLTDLFGVGLTLGDASGTMLAYGFVFAVLLAVAFVRRDVD